MDDLAPALSQLPWRGPDNRPELPIPPDKLPRRLGGTMRKRWRYVAAFAEPFMVCMARVQVGPFGQTFWALVDREKGEIHERTKMRPPGARGEVWRETRDGHLTDRARSGDVLIDLRVAEGEWAESINPTEGGAYVWTRKRCDVPVHCYVRLGDRHWDLEARGVEDESAGYHPRHTVWSWSAGVGKTKDGRSVGWNLVEGVNDPVEKSERAIWVDGSPSEPPPSHFDGLKGINFDDGSRLDFKGEAERRASQNLLVISYEYRQPFGTFTGTLPGGIELESGIGVMEFHDAKW